MKYNFLLKKLKGAFFQFFWGVFVTVGFFPGDFCHVGLWSEGLFPRTVCSAVAGGGFLLTGAARLQDRARIIDPQTLFCPPKLCPPRKIVASFEVIKIHIYNKRIK